MKIMKMCDLDKTRRAKRAEKDFRGILKAFVVKHKESPAREARRESFLVFSVISGKIRRIRRFSVVQNLRGGVELASNFLATPKILS